ncbi:hypothetical protein FACS189472_06190 [Alphaproteobacteria bacterium]|nr:hypothetical protein FACS189472_06190 [Alphaproteobacteria bacterium]
MMMGKLELCLECAKKIFYRNDDFSSSDVGYSWSREFLSLFYPNCTPKWKDKNQEKVALIMDMSFDACLDKCNNPVLDPQEQAFCKGELLNVRLYCRRWSTQRCVWDSLPPININRLRELPYDLCLLVLADFEICGYARFFFKSQFRWIPIQCIEKGNFGVICTLCDNKDKLPKEHIAALDKRINVLLEQWSVARDAAESAVVDKSYVGDHIAKARDSSLYMLTKVRELREKFKKD